MLAKEERLLTKEEAGEFYEQHKGSVSVRRPENNTLLFFLQENFEELIEFMSRYRIILQFYNFKDCFPAVVHA